MKIEEAISILNYKIKTKSNYPTDLDKITIMAIKKLLEENRGLEVKNRILLTENQELNNIFDFVRNKV